MRIVPSQRARRRRERHALRQLGAVMALLVAVFAVLLIARLLGGEP